MRRWRRALAARAGDRAASNRAVELIGKHLGMFVDKKSIDISYIDDSDEYLRQLMEVVNAMTPSRHRWRSWRTATMTTRS